VHFNITPVWNVMGELKGSEEPEKVVLLGNHRDAWVLGAADPVSGSASMLEVVRGFGELIKTGWRPKRTIMFASWDAEEYGMVGSTEFVEQYAQSLGSSLIAYLNVDVGACGPLFRIDATPSLSEMIRRLARLVEDPATGLSLYEAWLSGYATNSSAASLSPAAKEQEDERTFPLVNTLGSGSDFVGFVDMLGVASINAGFRGPYGVYHSLYDSFHWMSKYGDPGFHYVSYMNFQSYFLNS
jgi:N-acetylated-alpha-linked acidic dipeptidase